MSSRTRRNHPRWLPRQGRVCWVPSSVALVRGKQPPQVPQRMPGSAMVEEHRGPSRYDHLLDPVFDDEGGGGWMISYMDIMTLLVALLVLILVAAGVVGLPWRADAEPRPEPVALRLGIPLPEELRALTATAVRASPVTPPGRL